VTNSGETLTIVGNIAGVGGINKEGLGTLALSGANTYGGTLKVNAGILSAQNSRALGTIAAGTIVAGGAELTLQGNISIGYEPLTLAGYGVGGAGALVNVSDSNAYAGLITLINTTQINSNSGTLTLAGGVTGGYQLVFDGSSNITFTTTAIAIGGSPVTKNGSGTLTYNFPNTYTGLTTVNAGTLQYGVNDALATGGLTVTAGTVNIGSYSDNVGAVTVGTLDNAVGTITGSTGVLTSTSYTINAGTISAIIAGQGVSVTKNTPFTGVLTRANLFSGGVIIQGGILKIQNGGALGLIDGATSVAAGSTLQIDGSGLTIPNYISVYGTGMYFAGAIWNSSGSNTISGLITLGAAAQLDADSGTTLTVDGKGISAATYALTFDGGGNFTFTSTAPIYGTTAALVMSASGTLTVQSFSDYTGTTTVNTGAMVLRACLESFKYQRDKGQHDHLEAGC
jgi:autotransporter-associated beta strand protein